MEIGRLCMTYRGDELEGRNAGELHMMLEVARVGHLWTC